MANDLQKHTEKIPQSFSSANKRVHQHDDDGHPYSPPQPGYSRSPCPALNTLANHGYLPRSGHNLTFFGVIRAIRKVYHLSLPLALLLATVGFVTSGEIVWEGHREITPTTKGNKFLAFLFALRTWLASLVFALLPFLAPPPSELREPTPFPFPSLVLHLENLARRGEEKIAHDGSLVHPDGVESTAPDRGLVNWLVGWASGGRKTKGGVRKTRGLTLRDLAHLHAVRTHGKHLNHLHESVALGECGIAWCVMRSGKDNVSGDNEGGIAPSTVERWFGEERLPDCWWDRAGALATESGDICHRPSAEVGLLEVRKRVKEVAEGCEEFE